MVQGRFLVWWNDIEDLYRSGQSVPSRTEENTTKRMTLNKPNQKKEKQKRKKKAALFSLKKIPIKKQISKVYILDNPPPKKENPKETKK